MGGKTSYEVSQRWKKANYRRIGFYVNKEDGWEFAEKCKKNGDIQSEVLRQAMYDYLGKPMPPSRDKARF